MLTTFFTALPSEIQRQDTVVFPKISLQRIKNLEVKFRQKSERRKRLRRAVCIAGAAAVLAVVSKTIWDYKNPSEGNDATPQLRDGGEELRNREEKIKERYADLAIKNLERGRSFGWIVGSRFIDTLAIGCATVMLTSFYHFYDELTSWWQTLENGNPSYVQFYCKQMVSVHKTFVASIENLIASMAASLDKNKKKSLRDWLLSDQNGLVEDANFLAESLSSMLNEHLGDFKLFVEKALSPLLHRLILELERFKDDFKID